jgi:hypothetical protein
MTAAAALGPKGETYVELTAAEWRAPLERSSVRRSLVTAAMSLALIVMGVLGALNVYPEAFALVGLGALGLYTTWSDLQLIRHEFEESRRVGWVEVAVDEEQVQLGDPLTVRISWHARHARAVRGASLVLAHATWSQNTPRAEHVVAMLELPGSDRALRAGETWRASGPVRMPANAPSSHYDADASVRWTLRVTVHFDGVAPWERTLPIIVYPMAADA